MPAEKRRIRQDTVENCATGKSATRPPLVESAFHDLKRMVAGDKIPVTVQDAQVLYEYILGLEIFISGAYRTINVAPVNTMPSEKTLDRLRDMSSKIKQEK